MSAIDRPARELAHTHGPATSHAAARGDRNTNRDLVLRAFRVEPQTSFQAYLTVNVLGLDLTEVRRRCTDLKMVGLLEPTGRTIPEQPKKAGQELRLTAEGRTYLGLAAEAEPERLF